MIPACFDGFNQVGMFGGVDQVKFMHALRMSGVLSGGKPGYASQCAQCNTCLEKCPQHIEIPTMLAQVAAELEGPGLEERVAMARKVFKIEA
jgi:predicted aldo/keto reductase-like oxidoreductase